MGKRTLIETTRQVLREQRLVFDDRMPPEARQTLSVQTVYHALLTYPSNQAASTTTWCWRRRWPASSANVASAGSTPGADDAAASDWADEKRAGGA